LLSEEQQIELKQLQESKDLDAEVLIPVSSSSLYLAICVFSVFRSFHFFLFLVLCGILCYLLAFHQMLNISVTSYHAALLAEFPLLCKRFASCNCVAFSHITCYCCAASRYIYKAETRTFVTQDLRRRRFSDKISTPMHINIT